MLWHYTILDLNFACYIIKDGFNDNFGPGSWDMHGLGDKGRFMSDMLGRYRTLVRLRYFRLFLGP